MSQTPRKWDRLAVYIGAVSAFSSLVAILVSGYLACAAINEQRRDSEAALGEQRDEARIAHLVEEEESFDREPLSTALQRLARERIDRKREVLLPMSYYDSPSEMWDLLNECDHLGLLAQRGYLDAHDVWSDLGFWLFYIYADAKPVIEADRKDDPEQDRRGNPASMTSCSWLIEQMKPFELKEDNGVDLNLSSDDIYNFYLSEIDTPAGKPPSHSKKK